VNQLSGKSHLLFPGKESIAVRSYFPKQILEIEGSTSEHEKKFFNIESTRITDSVPSKLGENSIATSKLNELRTSLDSKMKEYKDDSEEIISFRNSYKYSIIFFVLPNTEMRRNQLDRPNSFLMRTQRLLTLNIAKSMKVRESFGRSSLWLHLCKLMSDFDSIDLQLILINSEKAVAKVHIVPDVKSIFRILWSTIDSIQPEKLQLKCQFFDRLSEKNGIPDIRKGAIKSEPSYTSLLIHVFRTWAERYKIPLFEINILIEVFGSLGSITHAKPSDLAKLPITNSSKEVLKDFFGTDEHQNLQLFSKTKVEYSNDQYQSLNRRASISYIHGGAKRDKAHFAFPATEATAPTNTSNYPSHIDQKNPSYPYASDVKIEKEICMIQSSKEVKSCTNNEANISNHENHFQRMVQNKKTSRNLSRRDCLLQSLHNENDHLYHEQNEYSYRAVKRNRGFTNG